MLFQMWIAGDYQVSPQESFGDCPRRHSATVALPHLLSPLFPISAVSTGSFCFGCGKVQGKLESCLDYGIGDLLSANKPRQDSSSVIHCSESISQVDASSGTCRTPCPSLQSSSVPDQFSSRQPGQPIRTGEHNSRKHSLHRAR